MLVASTGGHLEELIRLRLRLRPVGTQHDWATFRDPQSLSLLAGERVFYVRYVPPRGYREALGNLTAAHHILQEGGYARVVSTGSAIAVPFILAARARGVACHYIESAARTSGPSLTGRVVSRVPGVHVYSQYPGWSGRRWDYRGTLFDTYEAAPPTAASRPRARTVVVTLGTMRTYGFRRAVERLVEVLPEVTAEDAQVIWQVGATDTSGLGIQAEEWMPAPVLREAVAEADLVVAHAGIGSALVALDQGKAPVLLPRRSGYGEHVDDHQTLIADALASRGLAVSADASELTAAHLRAALATGVRHRPEQVPFRLSG